MSRVTDGAYGLARAQSRSPLRRIVAYAMSELITEISGLAAYCRPRRHTAARQPRELAEVSDKRAVFPRRCAGAEGGGLPAFEHAGPIAPEEVLPVAV